MDKQLHIIAFDVPYPPNYGGIVDVFYKLKTLHELGVKITYHCFYYAGNNEPSDDLANYCDKLYYYPRKKNVGKLLMSRYPFVVASRYSKDLLNRLLEDDAPILFDGIQTCYYLNHPKLVNRHKLFRANNIEHDYYRGLAKWETNPVKQAYYRLEAKKLKRFENVLTSAQGILSVAKMDIPHFSQYAPTFHLPPFFNQATTPHLSDDIHPFCLFQGNLSVTENIEAAQFIIKKVAPMLSHKICIAGKNPSAKLTALAQKQANVELIANPDQTQMEDLISKAQVNLLFTFQQTGIKLKLLHALSSGKHIIINDYMDDSGLFTSLCTVANAPKTIAKNINDLMVIPFTETHFRTRTEQFHLHFDNRKNGQKIVDLLTSGQK